MIPFDGSFAAQTAQEFIDHVLVERLGAERVSVGENFRFGNRARGDADAAARAGRVRDARRRSWSSSTGEIISSTHIRGLVAAGDVAAAARFLGAPFHMRGTIAHGDKRGRTLGFPTANLVPDPRARGARPRDLRLPRRGRRRGATWRPSTSACGRPSRPAAGCSSRRSCSTSTRDIYGRELRLDFLERLRGEKRFDSVEALVEQMGHDVRDTPIAARAPRSVPRLCSRRSCYPASPQ